jgi:UDP-N-acetyl-D-mannosaminuronic acid dehydrogenase
MTIIDRIESREATVAVLGMGRVGLPLGIAFAAAGLRVMGVDPDPAIRATVALGKMPFHDPGCEDLLAEAVHAGRLSAHADPAEAVPSADAVVLCVGTPLGADLRPDYDQLRSALSGIAPHLRPGQLLVQRSTVSPGTLNKVVLPYLRECAPRAAEGLLVAACPERIAEGAALTELRSVPEIVGGVDEASSRAAAALFATLGPDKPIHVTTATAAELAKLFTNVYRYVNFALANEFAVLAEYYREDAHEIIRMVNEGYPRANVARPGPAGGPCLSKDGYFLVEELTLPDFVLTAWKLNDSAPAHVVRRFVRRLELRGVPLAGTPIAVLGQTFKRDSDDLRQSPAIRITQILRREGCDVRVHDPFLPGLTLQQALAGARGFVLATNHSQFDSLDPSEVASLMEDPRVGIDAWGTLDRNRFAAAGVELLTFGVGDEL